MTERLPGPTVNVRWVSSISSGVRVAKESSFGLTVRRRRDAQTWEYELADPSTANLASLVRDPSVEDTAGFDRGQLRVDESMLDRWRRELGVPRIHLLPDLFTETNTQAILYYLLMFLPVAAVVVLALWRSERLALSSGLPRPGLQLGVVVVLALLQNLFLIRGNIDSRLGDVIVPGAVLAGWLLGAILTGRVGRPTMRASERPDESAPVARGRFRAVRVTVATACAAVLMLWVLLYGEAATRVRQAGLLAGPVGLATAIGERVRVFAGDPLDYLAPRDAIEGSRALMRYVRQCVDEDDRVVGIEYMPELFYGARRGFAGGMVVYSHWVDSGRLQRQAIDRLRRQSVPVVIVDERERAHFEEHFPLLAAALWARYSQSTPLEFPQGDRFTVATDPAWRPTGVYEPLGLPCFVPPR